MKNILKKNQVIIAALAIMIIVAGYLNFTKGKVDDSVANPDIETQGEVVSDGTSEIPEAELSESNMTGLAEDGDKVASENANANSEVGEAVLANQGINADFFVKNKLKREQTRAQSEESLKGIINDTNVSEAQKQDAIDKMIELTDIKEKETVTETLLEAKGFSEALVTITDDTVEVVVNANNLSEQQMAQIEDVVKRKTGISAKNIVISPINVVEETASTTEENAEETLDETSVEGEDVNADAIDESAGTDKDQTQKDNADSKTDTSKEESK